MLNYIFLQLKAITMSKQAKFTYLHVSLNPINETEKNLRAAYEADKSAHTPATRKGRLEARQAFLAANQFELAAAGFSDLKDVRIVYDKTDNTPNKNMPIKHLNTWRIPPVKAAASVALAVMLTATNITNGHDNAINKKPNTSNKAHVKVMKPKKRMAHFSTHAELNQISANLAHFKAEIFPVAAVDSALLIQRENDFPATFEIAVAQNLELKRQTELVDSIAIANNPLVAIIQNNQVSALDPEPTPLSPCNKLWGLYDSDKKHITEPPTRLARVASDISQAISGLFKRNKKSTSEPTTLTSKLYEPIP